MAGHTCSECKWFWYAAPQSDQPYPEFACMSGHWDGIGSKEEQDALTEENTCEDFELEFKK